MFIISTATFVIKLSCSITTIFVSVNVRFVDSKSLLKINSSSYISHDKLPLMKYVLPVTVHLNLLSVIKKFLQMSHLLQLTIVRLLLMLGLGYKEGGNISFRFLLRL